MKKQRQNAADGMLPRSAKENEASEAGSAPQEASVGAFKNAAKASQNNHSCTPERTVFERKYRFMLTLLDKLKMNGNGCKPVSNVNSSSDQPAAQDNTHSNPSDANALLKEGAQVDTDHLSNQAREHWLGETHSSDLSPRPMSFTYSPGSKPLPRHTIRRGIGMGGFGEVYFAVTDAGKEVALKRIQRNLEVELRGVSQCLNLKHSNLVALFDICKDEEGQSWVTMEYVAGLNLRQVLDESPEGLAIDEVHRWFGAIASGVNHLHLAGLVHRDLKPGNVFDDLGIVKVGDYGLSKFISSSHRGGHTESVGTFHYMAPEIGRGQYGREIDIYALGILLYELLTGQVPFDGESCHEIIVKHLTATPDLGEIAEPYRSTISRCLEKDPARRFSTIDEMMQSLDMATYRGATIPVDAVVHSKSKSGTASSPSAPQGAVPVTLVRSGVAPVEGSSAADADSSTTEEPFARAIRESFGDLSRWWRTLDQSPGAKLFLLLVAGFVLLVNTHWLLPLMSFVAVFYVPYYIVRQMVLHVHQQPTYAEAQRIATAVGGPTRPLTKVQWRSHMRTDLRAKRSIHRVAELNTSWIAATMTTIGLMLGAGVIGLRSGVVDAVSLAPYGWMATVVLLASLAILGMGKLWEREDGEALPRRLVLAGLGAGVGVAAFSVNDFLMLPMDSGLGREIDATTLPQAFYVDGVPVASGWMAHFALLFGALRWWKPVDPLRRTRLSLWSVAVAVVAEWAVHQVLPIPQPAGLMIAGGIAIAVQMSAPWINPSAVKTPEHVPPSTRDSGVRSMV